MLGLSVNTLAAADGDTIYVSSSGDDANSGLTLATAKKTIKNATDTVNPGGTVIIADGTYNGSGNSNINITKSMTIEGSSQSGTILDGLDSARIFQINSGCTVTVRDLTIINGKSNYGCGIYSDGYLTVINCKFTKCTTYRYFMGGGSAIFSGDNSRLNVQDSVFTGNDATASHGGGGTIYTNEIATIDNCDFIGNYAANGAVVYSLEGDINMNGCRFVNNEANSGGVLWIYSKDTIIKIHNSAFINNTARNGASSNNINNSFDSYLDVTDNWWGSNTGPNGILGAINKGSSWIYMNLSVNASTTKYMGQIDVKADFNNIYHNDTNTTTHENVGSILDGFYTDFSSDLGILSPDSAVISSGAAKSVFTAAKCGTGNVTAQFNSQTLNNSITVEPVETILTTNNASGYNGRIVNLTAKLSTQSGSLLSGKNITFKVNGTSLGSAITGSDGTANLEYNITQTQGTYNITADFAGDSTCLANNSNGTLTVNVLNTIMKVNSVSTYNGKTVNLKASLKDVNRNSVAEKRVTFSLNGNVVGSAVTGADGVATLSYKLSQSGNYQVTADFAGDYVYVASRGTGKAEVTPVADLYLNSRVSSEGLKTGDKFVIIYKLGNNGFDAAKDVTITFKLPEGLEFQDIAIDSGNWTYNSTTRMVTWTSKVVPVGDPYLFLSVRAVNGGTYTITPKMTSSTYNMNTGSNGAITMQVQSNNSSTTNSTVISTQKTGFPLNYIILAVLIVLGGFGAAKRK